VKTVAHASTGRCHIARIARSGSVLGLREILSSAPYEAQAATLEPSRIAFASKQNVLGMLREDQSFAFRAARYLSTELHEAYFSLKRSTTLSTARGRLASVLLELAGSNSGHTDIQLKIPRTLTHEELGELIGCSRETVTRTLNKFSRNGLIAIANRHILILSRDRLLTHCSS
jgi:CRP/FNR family transcriptional regulator